MVVEAGVILRFINIDTDAGRSFVTPALPTTQPIIVLIHPTYVKKRIGNYSGCVKLDRHLLYEHASLVIYSYTAPRKVPVKLANG
jgi:hypothetical protein